MTTDPTNCPTCGAPMRQGACTECEYRTPQAPRRGSGLEDPNRYRCAWVSTEGDRCGNLGSISGSTMNRGPDGRGLDGPWYCTKHFGCADRAEGDRVVRDSRADYRLDPLDTARHRFLAGASRTPGAGPLDAQELARALGRKWTDRERPNPRSWATTLLQRAADGERIPAIALRMAEEVAVPVPRATAPEVDEERAAIIAESEAPPPAPSPMSRLRRLFVAQKPQSSRGVDPDQGTGL